ncbi:MAG: hypothetical protein WCH01_11055, partial [Methylococcaceae bacterium]
LKIAQAFQQISEFAPLGAPPLFAVLSFRLRRWRALGQAIKQQSPDSIAEPRLCNRDVRHNASKSPITLI